MCREFSITKLTYCARGVEQKMLTVCKIPQNYQIKLHLPRYENEDRPVSCLTHMRLSMKIGPTMYYITSFAASSSGPQSKTSLMIQQYAVAMILIKS